MCGTNSFSKRSLACDSVSAIAELDSVLMAVYLKDTAALTI
jgi:hypothetical protein